MMLTVIITIIVMQWHNFCNFYFPEDSSDYDSSDYDFDYYYCYNEDCFGHLY